jgi:hypothetical protein
MAPSSGFATEADTEPSGEGLQVRTPDGNVQRASVQAIGHAVANGRILAWDLVSDDGASYLPACEHPELSHLFGRSDLSLLVQRTCTNHEGSALSGTCRKCGRGYCEACASSLFRRESRVCPACGGAVKEPDPRLTETPPWERIRDVTRYPIDGNGWKATIGVGALIWVSAQSLWAIPVYLVALALIIHVILASSRGEKRYGDRGTLDARQLFEQWQPAAVLSVAVSIPFIVLPLILGTELGVFLHFPFALLAFFYYPMALGAVLLAGDKQKALQPKTVLRAILSLKESYFLAVVTLIAVAVLVIVLQALLGFIPFIGGIAGILALAYGIVLQAHLLGWFLYMNRERILAVL